MSSGQTSSQKRKSSSLQVEGFRKTQSVGFPTFCSGYLAPSEIQHWPMLICIQGIHNFPLSHCLDASHGADLLHQDWGWQLVWARPLPEIFTKLSGTLRISEVFTFQIINSTFCSKSSNPTREEPTPPTKNKTKTNKKDPFPNYIQNSDIDYFYHCKKHNPLGTLDNLWCVCSNELSSWNHTHSSILHLLLVYCDDKKVTKRNSVNATAI